MGPFTLDRLKLVGLRERVGKLRSGKDDSSPIVHETEDEPTGRFVPPIASLSAKEGPHPNGASHPSWGKPLNAVKGIFSKGRRRAESSDSAEPEDDYRPTAVNGRDSSEPIGDLNLEQAIELLQNELQWSDAPQPEEGRDIRSRLPDGGNKPIDRAKDNLRRRTKTLTV